MLPRFYLPANFDIGTAKLSGSEAHHLMNVLRLKKGDQVCLFDGNGCHATAEITEFSRSDLTLRILEVEKTEAEALDSLTLATAVPKSERFRWLVEKATELGVSRFVPLQTARSIVHPGEGKLQKMHQTMIAACKQSGRNRLMSIEPLATWEQFLKDHDSHAALFVADPNGPPAAETLARVRSANPHHRVTLAIGPEGGLTDEELQAAIDNGAQPASLGPNILRIETAAIALASLVVLSSQSDD